MALAPTERLEETSAQGFGVGAFTSSAFTPTANSRLVVYIGGVTDSAGLVSGLTVTNSASVHLKRCSPISACKSVSGTSNSFGAWYAADADFGGSPGSMTISAIAAKTNLTTLAVYQWNIFVADVTGHNATHPTGVFGFSRGQADPGALAYNLTGAPQAGSMVLAGISIQFGDGEPNPVPGSGWSELCDIPANGIGFAVMSDATTPDSTVEYTSIVGTATTFHSYAATAIEIVAAGETPADIFPKVATAATTVSTGSVSLVCNMPAGIVAGDLLMAFVCTDNVDAAASGWTEIEDTANGTAVRGFCFAKVAAGSDTLTVTGPGSQDIAVRVERITEHGVANVATDITKGTVATGTSVSPNAPNCNPGTSADRLWVLAFWSDDDDNASNWVNQTSGATDDDPDVMVKSATGTTAVMLGVASRMLNATALDPGVFTLAASEEWIAQTFAIPPVAAAAAAGRPIARRRYRAVPLLVPAGPFDR